jgi:glyoxylase-like metal-dependent hydrolase (beta-lactamase superfamily II)
VHIYKVAEDTYAIDPALFDIREFTSVYLLVGDSLTLIDSGSPKSAPLILNGIQSLGYSPKDVTRIILSHIHFDHGSGAGELLKFMPRAIVYVHHKGYKHLIDPSRLTASAERVFGKMIEEWYGGFAPIPKEKIISGNDGDIIDLGGNRKLKVLATSGHARHEICLYDPAIGGLFAGDEAGIYFPYGPAIIPTSPPPDFDPDQNIKTIKQLQALKPEMLLFAHYLTTKAVDKTLRASMDALASWKEIVGEGLREGLDFDAIVNSLRTQTIKALEFIKNREDLLSWIMDYHIPMCASGYINYLTKKFD